MDNANIQTQTDFEGSSATSNNESLHFIKQIFLTLAAEDKTQEKQSCPHDNKCDQKNSEHLQNVNNPRGSVSIFYIFIIHRNEKMVLNYQRRRMFLLK